MKCQCFVCKESIENNDNSGLDPCAVTICTNMDQDASEQRSQTFFCHLECFKKVHNDNSTLYLESMSAPKEMEEERITTMQSVSEFTQILYESGEQLGVLDRLFSKPSGTWLPLREVLGGALSDEVNAIEDLLYEPLVICWTDDYSAHQRSQNRDWKVAIIATESHYEYTTTLLLDFDKGRV
jgi:hypothetical protein